MVSKTLHFKLFWCQLNLVNFNSDGLMLTLNLVLVSDCFIREYQSSIYLLVISHYKDDIVVTPHACTKDKAIVLYVCRHKNRHFGKSRHLSDLLASLFSRSLQKTAFSPLAYEHHEQHLLSHHCCHPHIILIKAQIFLHAIVNIAM